MGALSVTRLWTYPKAGPLPASLAANRPGATVLMVMAPFWGPWDGTVTVNVPAPIAACTGTWAFNCVGLEYSSSTGRIVPLESVKLTDVLFGSEGGASPVP